MGFPHHMPACPAAALAALLATGCSEPEATPPAMSASAPVTASAPSASASSAAEPPTRCGTFSQASLWVSPRSPTPTAPLRVVAIVDDAIDGTLELRRGDEVVATTEERRGGPPYRWVLSHEVSQPGALEARLLTPAGAACTSVDVVLEAKPRPIASAAAVWPVERAWSGDAERFFSAWIEHLFDAPLSEQPAWPALYEVLRDRERNLLFNHLGEGEDDATEAPAIEPDCADLPYVLRAYFAAKLGLPFGYSRCSRGGAYAPPKCHRWQSSLNGNDGSQSAMRRLGNFVRVRLADTVHSGTVRVKGEDDGGDFYPVALTDESLRPGTVFADPYGHILVVARRVPQTGDRGGLLLAVDGQPDGTVSRRRFWRGNFLFSDDPVYGGPGFKRFRPVVLEGGRPRPLTNAEIAAHADYGDYDLAQYEGGIDGFYDGVEKVVSPRPRDPERAFVETVDALDEQVKRRVLSVDNAVAYKKDHRGRIDMPEGSEIFQTQGPWEDYSTPSRDMRLLIAIDVVRKLPERVAAHPERWAMPEGVTPEKLEETLKARLVEETKKRSFTYTKSDGSPQKLTLADVLARLEGLEMAYNPNDCPERRWAAPEDSDEMKTCNAIAPLDQRKRMAEHRPWFHDRQRPPP